MLMSGGLNVGNEPKLGKFTQKHSNTTQCTGLEFDGIGVIIKILLTIWLEREYGLEKMPNLNTCMWESFKPRLKYNDYSLYYTIGRELMMSKAK